MKKVEFLSIIKLKKNVSSVKTIIAINVRNNTLIPTGVIPSVAEIHHHKHSYHSGSA